MATNASSAPSVRPLWIPPGVEFESLPTGLQAALVEIVNPAYQRMVLERDDPQEKSFGLSHVHLLWLEIVQQIELGNAMAKLLPRGQGAQANADSIAAHLRLIKTKERIARCYLRVKASKRPRNPFEYLNQGDDPPWPKEEGLGTP
jgi:hypothetical protein